MIKALLFDYGGVIANDSAGEKLSENLAANLSIDNQAALNMIGPLWHQFTRGKITEAEIWESLEKQYGQPIPLSKRDIWNSWGKMPYFTEMVDFVRELKRSGYTVGMVSTTVAPTAADIRAHGGYDLFDPVILSCDIGYAKPDRETYMIAMEHLPDVRPDEVIFLDDREMCLPPAAALGIHTVLVKEPNQAIIETRKLLAQELNTSDGA
jgi:putative hydrolase of the HAD superfamily